MKKVFAVASCLCISAGVQNVYGFFAMGHENGLGLARTTTWWSEIKSARSQARTENGQNEFNEAVRNIFVQEPRYLLNKNATYARLDELRERGAKVAPILIARAAYKGQVDMVHYFVERGADIDHNGKLKGKSDYGTPLNNAVFHQNWPLMYYLLSNGANPNKQSNVRGSVYCPLRLALDYTGEVGNYITFLLIVYGATLSEEEATHVSVSQKRILSSLDQKALCVYAGKKTSREEFLRESGDQAHKKREENARKYHIGT